MNNSSVILLNELRYQTTAFLFNILGFSVSFWCLEKLQMLNKSLTAFKISNK